MVTAAAKMNVYGSQLCEFTTQSALKFPKLGTDWLFVVLLVFLEVLSDRLQYLKGCFRRSEGSANNTVYYRGMNKTKMWVTATTSPWAYRNNWSENSTVWNKVPTDTQTLTHTWPNTWSPPGLRLAEIIKSLNEFLAHPSLTLCVWYKPSASCGSLIVCLLLAR